MTTAEHTYCALGFLYLDQLHVYADLLYWNCVFTHRMALLM